MKELSELSDKDLIKHVCLTWQCRTELERLLSQRLEDAISERDSLIDNKVKELLDGNDTGGESKGALQKAS